MHLICYTFTTFPFKRKLFLFNLRSIFFFLKGQSKDRDGGSNDMSFMIINQVFWIPVANICLDTSMYSSTILYRHVQTRTYPVGSICINICTDMLRHVITARKLQTKLYNCKNYFIQFCLEAYSMTNIN